MALWVSPARLLFLLPQSLFGNRNTVQVPKGDLTHT